MMLQKQGCARGGAGRGQDSVETPMAATDSAGTGKAQATVPATLSSQGLLAFVTSTVDPYSTKKQTRDVSNETELVE
ncbi:hypothetical protein MLD38_012901 [Melastoma candidum]|uniref:Uncharacterized protein n=1 Tax=Melastoma candidum TaxID=119954 RepID=A0ACB9RC10_9MYRT|nr:hypothetical protein MLD38_012901 [Melastoma candidum]